MCLEGLEVFLRYVGSGGRGGHPRKLFEGHCGGRNIEDGERKREVGEAVMYICVYGSCTWLGRNGACSVMIGINRAECRRRGRAAGMQLLCRDRRQG